MKTKISLVALATALSMGASFAADLPSRKAPVYVAPPPPTLWTGFYAGLNAGYDWGISTNSQTVAGGLYDNYATGILGAPFGLPGAMSLANSGNANVNRSGFIGGGQIGYNYQWGPSFVVGLEADIQGAGIRGNGSFTGAAADSATPLAFPPFFALGANRASIASTTIEAHQDWLGTVDARVGYLVTPTALLYVKGGLAYGGAQASVTSVSGNNANFNFLGFAGASFGSLGAGYGSNSSTLVGWNVGGGAEWMLAPNWSVKFEAFYYDLGSLNVNAVHQVSYGLGFGLGPFGFGRDFGWANGSQTNVRMDGVVARVGVNYHFNWAAPAAVLAKY
jgi:outer membrane immunogenic protein